MVSLVSLKYSDTRMAKRRNTIGIKNLNLTSSMLVVVLKTSRLFWDFELRLMSLQVYIMKWAANTP